MSWSNTEQKWIASIQLRGESKKVYKGSSLEEAKRAREEAEKKCFAPVIEEWERYTNKLQSDAGEQPPIS